MTTTEMTRTANYEGFFLFPHGATSNLQQAVDHVRTILERAGAKIISFRKWDERRLAYEIKGNKRGLYFLVYFTAETSKIRAIERDCNLSEQLLRAMVLRVENLTEEEMQAADGQEDLATEIKLRSERAVAEAADASGNGDDYDGGDDDDFSDDDDD